MEAAFEGNYLKDTSNLINLAGLLMLHDIPYKAARLMEDAIKQNKIDASRANIERLGQAWLMAGEYERAIPHLRMAAQGSDSGEGFVRLANTFMALGRWQDTADTLDQALTKGGLTDPGTTHLIRGMALFRLNRYEAASNAFESAKQFAATEKLAQQWSDYMTNEISKLNALKDS